MARYFLLPYFSDGNILNYLRRFDLRPFFQERNYGVKQGLRLYYLPRNNYVIKTTNRLKPTGHAMHHQFNIQQLYALPTLYLCVLYLSENKQRLVPLTA